MQLVSKTFPKQIQIRARCGAGLPMPWGDAVQLHQVLMNLCINARDAMAAGGTLTIEARLAALDASFVRTTHMQDVAPGPYLALSVADSGTGMTPETLERIFDPFFTTKGPQQGTGLGLSTAVGIVKGHRGILHVDSEHGHGSVFTVYLPVSTSA